MKRDYAKILKAFEKEYGQFADFKGTREAYFGGLMCFADGWQAGKSFQHSVYKRGDSASSRDRKSKVSRPA